MAGKRYAVLDANGLVINHILIDDPLPKGYWPGYGATLVPLEPVDASAGAGLDVVVLKFGDVIPQIGDTLDTKTGEVTKFVPEIKQDVDTLGAPISVASAPEVAFVKDVDPLTVKEVTVSDVSVIEAPISVTPVLDAPA